VKLVWLASRIKNAKTAGEAHSLLDQAHRTLVVERQDAERRQDLRSYARFSCMLGEYYLTTIDSSDALRPFGAAYMTACIAGEPLRLERGRACRGLARVYVDIGQFGLAAECAADALTNGGTESGSDLPAMLRGLLLRVADDRNELSCATSLYAAIRSVLLNEGPGASSTASLLDAKYGLAEFAYREQWRRASNDILPMADNQVRLGVLVALTRAAICEGFFDEAGQHVRDALETSRAHEPFWRQTAIHGLESEIHFASGRSDEALGAALVGWALGLPALLLCKDDYGRSGIRRTLAGCIATAIEVAHSMKDWNLLAELIENSRLQVTHNAQLKVQDDAPVSYPDWIVELLPKALSNGLLPKALSNGAIAAGQTAILCGDWKSQLSRPIVVYNRGSRRLIDALAQTDIEAARDFEAVDAFEDLTDGLIRGALVWSASVQRGILYWTLTDSSGSFSGGSLDLTKEPVTVFLSELRELLSAGPLDFSPYGHSGADVYSALSREGSPEEVSLTDSLAGIIPDEIKKIALVRTAQDPLVVMFSVPPELSAVPWGVLPIDRSATEVVRLVERVQLTFLTPAALRLASPPANSMDMIPRRLQMSVCNPAGDLLDAPAVGADRVLDGNPSGNSSRGSGKVSLRDFFELFVDQDWAGDGVLFIRSHLASASRAGNIADSGIAFADKVLTARNLSVRSDSGEPVARMPRRVVLALCSGSGSADASGLALGLAASCRLAGAEEVLTSNYDVLDTEWAGEFDHRLASAAIRPEPMSVAFRELQLASLKEWKLASMRSGFSGADIDPLPLIWASYGVVN
jgi:hypothetical protein